MGIRVIVELTAKPGQRAELRRVLEGIIATHGETMPGYLGSTRYEVVDQPDMLVELADWESLETREPTPRKTSRAITKPAGGYGVQGFSINVMRSRSRQVTRIRFRYPGSNPRPPSARG